MRDVLRQRNMNNVQKLTNRLTPRSIFVLSAITFFASGTFTFAQRAEDIIFTPEKIKTIPGHGMSKGEYPYDEDGYYRKEWVSVSAKSSVRSSTTVRQPIPLTSEEHSNYGARKRINQSKVTESKVEDQIKPSKPEVVAKQTPLKPTFSMPTANIMSDAEARKHGFIGPFEKMQETSRNVIPTMSLAQTSVSAKSSISAVYHKVNSGDTLFSISRKYGSTVDAIKKANGLTSDLIRVGQSLRLALAQHTLGIPQ